jgi:hypothetical protein
VRSFRVAAGTVLLAVGLLAAVSLPTAAAPTNTGCPAAYELRTVKSLAATGNEPAPSLVDAAGNNDGLVCARPLPDVVCPADPCPVETIYVFTDNNVPLR